MDFPNNRSVLDLCLSRPIGLFALLDEESRFPQSNDSTLLEKWRKNIEAENFSVRRISTNRSESCFAIKHYGGEIEYNVVDFLEKNRDFLSENLFDLMKSSGDKFLSSIFSTSKTRRTTKTVSNYFRLSLMNLVGEMASKKCHFVRCLVPNRSSTLVHRIYDHSTYFPINYRFDGDLFDREIIFEQIRSTGLFETIEIRRSGFPHRILIEEFVRTYSCLVDFDPQREKNRTIESIFDKFNEKNFLVGKRKIFLKNVQREKLNFERNRILAKIVRIQSSIRRFIVAKRNSLSNFDFQRRNSGRFEELARNFLLLCSKPVAKFAAIKIQSFWRMWREKLRFRDELRRNKNEKLLLDEFSRQIQEKNIFHQEILQKIKAKTAKSPMLDVYYDSIVDKNAKKPTKRETSMPPVFRTPVEEFRHILASRSKNDLNVETKISTKIDKILDSKQRDNFSTKKILNKPIENNRIVFSSDEVQQIRQNLRKTGRNELDRTLRKEIPREPNQIDFRSVLKRSTSHFILK